MKAIPITLLIISVTAAVAPVRGQSSDARVPEVQEALLRLPYYGVFDFLTFTYEKGTVTLGGYAYNGRLSTDAERAVKRVPGIDTVNVRITQLPASPMDDEIRWRAFYAIYTNAFLSRYAPGGGLLWGHRHAIRFLGPFAGFPGVQPVGNYPIHIIVERGRLRLLGMVDNEADKIAAGMVARGVSGTFEVTNELVVDRP